MSYAALKQALPLPGQTTIDWPGFVRLIPELALLDHTPQDAEHHAEGDVGIHTRMVCSELLKNKEYQQAQPTDQFVWFYGALLHDISKPGCTKTEDSGKITSKGHSKKGAIDARRILWQAEVPFLIRERITDVVACHQVPFYFFRKTENLDFELFKLSYEVNLIDLVQVARADMQGRIYHGKQACLDDIVLFEELAKEKGVWGTPKAFPDDVTRMKYLWTNGGISPDFPFYREPGSQVYLLSGMPASGKSTWTVQHPELPSVSFDDAKAELGLDHGDNPGTAVQLVLFQAKQYLRKKQSFIWNATNLSKQTREKTLNLLYQYGATVTIVYCEAPEAVIMQRNQARSSTITNDRIKTLLYQWEVPKPYEAHSMVYAISENNLKSKMRPRRDGG